MSLFDASDFLLTTNFVVVESVLCNTLRGCVPNKMVMGSRELCDTNFVFWREYDTMMAVSERYDMPVIKVDTSFSVSFNNDVVCKLTAGSFGTDYSEGNIMKAFCSKVRQTSRVVPVASKFEFSMLASISGFYNGKFYSTSARSNGLVGTEDIISFANAIELDTDDSMIHNALKRVINTNAICDKILEL